VCSRDVYEFRSLLASWNERCARYELAYNREVERNKRITKAYQLLTSQHEQALNDLAVQASKFRSQQKELEIMQTDTLAQEAVIEGYTRRLAAQPVIHREPERTNYSLVRRVAELEAQLLSMQSALVSASKMLASSKPRTW
jgi:hypothetical protein